jgi:protein-S-isoprenylcysteine O-methyltransferase Ste14
MCKQFYWLFSFLGLMTVWASFILGFRYDAEAPNRNIGFNLLIYGVFITVHIVLTIPAVKKAIYGARAGTLVERQIYVAITVVTWILVYWLHRPTGGFGWLAPFWLKYLGVCAYLLCLVGFFEFATFAGLTQLVGVPGSELSHSVGTETPLMMDGPYASVRHPMYRAAFFANACALMIHPNAAQLFWAILVAVSFVGFIPFEERQLLAARGDEYRAYCARTPYRIFPGIW